MARKRDYSAEYARRKRQAQQESYAGFWEKRVAVERRAKLCSIIYTGSQKAYAPCNLHP